MKIIDVFPDWITNGIFKQLDTLYDDLPWKADSISPLTLDMGYMARSAKKTISSAFDLLVDSGELTTEYMNIIISSLYTHYKVSWSKLYDTLSLEYNPIENYDSHEETTDTVTNTGSNIDTDSTTHSTLDKLEVNDSNYGFNSAMPVPSKDSSTTHTVTENNGGAVEHSHNTTTTTVHTLDRAGNIGVTTSQQMIQSERDLWIWNYFDSVYQDIDTFFTIKIYD